MALSVVDGRYKDRLDAVREIMSDNAYTEFRVYVEIKYFAFLVKNLPELHHLIVLLDAIEKLDTTDYIERVAHFEAITNHDVKAIEYYVKEKLVQIGISEEDAEFVHFCITSNDTNSVAYTLQVAYFVELIYVDYITKIIDTLKKIAESAGSQRMLTHTHGQAATPAKFADQIMVFVERLENELEDINQLKYSTKFGGATGGLNAHYATYPDYNWHEIMNNFIATFNVSGKVFKRNQYTTQIDHYDNHARFFDSMSRKATILIDLCRDFWAYISRGYLKQKVIKTQTGSSTMPHKVNPIDFENAEANFLLARNLLRFFSDKLPISREQRDLTDSSTLRNMGLAFSYLVIGFTSLLKGLGKISLNIDKLDRDLVDNWMVIAESVQCILRKHKFHKPYEALKDLTRGGDVDKEKMDNFIKGLDIAKNVIDNLIRLTPFSC